MSEKRIFLDYLLDMREALSDIHDFTLGMSFEAFRSDKKTLNAVLRSLEVLGEAAGKIPAEVRGPHPNFPWSDMVGMRNRLIHEYFGVDIAIVWQTVIEDLPPLASEMDQLIQEYSDT